MNRVREIRTSRKLTQQALADAAMISRPFLVDVEKGRRGAKPETWERIADALGVTINEVRGDGDAVSDNSSGGRTAECLTVNHQTNTPQPRCD